MQLSPAFSSILVEPTDDDYRRRRRGAGRARAPPPQKKKSGKIFSAGNYYLKFGYFLNFSYIFFGQKCRMPPKVD